MSPRRKTALQELVEGGCDEKLVRCCAEYLAKPKEEVVRLFLPQPDVVEALYDAVDRLEDFRRELLFFEVLADTPGFATVQQTIHTLQFQAALADNLILVLRGGPNPNLRGFCVKVLSDHIREKTGKANWKRLVRLVEEFGGNIDETALRQLHYNFVKSPESKIFD